MNYKAAFTLIESLVVIVLVSMILVITMLSFPTTLVDSVEQRLFLEELSTLIKFAQQDAILTQQTVTVEFNEVKNCIILKENYSQNMEVIQLPSSLNLLNSLELAYKPSARIGNYHTVYFEDLLKERVIQLVFQLGSGQFEIKKASSF